VPAAHLDRANGRHFPRTLRISTEITQRSKAAARIWLKTVQIGAAGENLPVSAGRDFMPD
jgi:hypothetical protein